MPGLAPLEPTAPGCRTTAEPTAYVRHSPLVATEAECRRAGETLLGEVLEDVRYVGLSYENPQDLRWDYGQWHWPEVGVELTTSSGRTFYCIWDDELVQFELRFAEGLLSERWLPLREDPAAQARVWNVATHRRWQPLLGSPVEGFEIVVMDLGGPPPPAPVAVRLWTTAGGVVWIVAAAPRGEAHARADLDSDDVLLGHDEIIVLFSDELARNVGLGHETGADLT